MARPNLNMAPSTQTKRLKTPQICYPSIPFPPGYDLGLSSKQLTAYVRWIDLDGTELPVRTSVFPIDRDPSASRWYGAQAPTGPHVTADLTYDPATKTASLRVGLSDGDAEINWHLFQNITINTQHGFDTGPLVANLGSPNATLFARVLQ